MDHVEIHFLFLNIFVIPNCYCKISWPGCEMEHKMHLRNQFSCHPVILGLLLLPLVAQKLLLTMTNLSGGPTLYIKTRYGFQADLQQHSYTVPD